MEVEHITNNLEDFDRHVNQTTIQLTNFPTVIISFLTKTVDTTNLKQPSSPRLVCSSNHEERAYTWFIESMFLLFKHIWRCETDN